MTARLLVLATLLVPAAAQAQQPRTNPSVALAINLQQFSRKEVRELEKRVHALEHKDKLHPRFMLDAGFLKSNDWDYALRVVRSRGLDFAQCGFNTTHYRWELYRAEGSLVDSGHDHRIKRLLSHVSRTIARDWSGADR